MKRISALLFLLGVLPARLFAGDAVVIGYNADGVWTSVTYYCSSTPEGGSDYKNRTEAREEAVRDLKRRGGGQMARIEVLAMSDLTGYVAVARGQSDHGRDVTVVGRGKSQAEADEKALSKLKRGSATVSQKIVYRYFSFGSNRKSDSVTRDD